MEMQTFRAVKKEVQNQSTTQVFAVGNQAGALLLAVDGGYRSFCWSLNAANMGQKSLDNILCLRDLLECAMKEKLKAL